MNTRDFRVYLMLLISPFVLALGERASAQVEVIPPKEFDLPRFYVDALNFASGSSTNSRLDIYIQVPYNELRFVKEGGQFVATYEVSARLYDANNALKLEKVWNETVSVADFSETVSLRGYSLSQRNFMLEPGNYDLTAQVRDNETGKTLKTTQPILIRDFSTGKLTLSSIMMISQLIFQGEKRSIVPNVSGNVGNLADSFYVFLEAYNYTGLDTLKFTYQILDAKKVEILSGAFSQSVVKGRNTIFIKIDNSHVTFGHYQLVVVATPTWYVDVTAENQDKELIALVSRPLVSRWANVPVKSGDINTAIDQLRYVATDTQIDSIKAGKSDKEKQERFLQFWKGRTNPSMEEYFGRVEYANAHFKAYREGWRTDMGMVFIIFGPPSNIDRHPFDMDNKPYEIWDYYELNRRFLFWDETGFGDYRLDPRTPIWQQGNRTPY